LEGHVDDEVKGVEERGDREELELEKWEFREENCHPRE